MPSLIIRPVEYNPRRRTWESCPPERAPSFAVIEVSDASERAVGYGASREEARRLRDRYIAANSEHAPVS